MISRGVDSTRYAAQGHASGGWVIIGSGGDQHVDVALVPAITRLIPFREPPAESGHDENISWEEMLKVTGPELGEKLRQNSLEIYQRAAEYARTRGIIIADTKFEWGLLPGGEVILIDEVLTPDSSRFWPADQYREGISPPSFDNKGRSCRGPGRASPLRHQSHLQPERIRTTAPDFGDDRVAVALARHGRKLGLVHGVLGANLPHHRVAARRRAGIPIFVWSVYWVLGGLRGSDATGQSVPARGRNEQPGAAAVF